MSVDTLQWAVTGYSLVGAAVIITSGSLGDVFGRKRIFQLGLLLFVVSCVLIALAGSGEHGDRRARDPGRRRRDDPGLRAEPAVGGHEWRRTAALGVAVGSRGRRGGGRRAPARRCPGRRHRAGRDCSGSTPASPCCAWCSPFVTVSRVARPGRGRARSTTPGTVLIALTLMPLILGVSKSGDWGWLSVGDPDLLRHRDRGRVRLRGRRAAGRRRRCSTWRCSATGSWSASTIAILIGAGTINGLMYLLSLYFQDPATLGFTPLRGRPGDAARDRRTGAGRTPGAPAGQEVRRPAGDRHRVHHHHRRLRRDRAWSTRPGSTPPSCSR